MRGSLYVDGFNLYHAISDLNQPHLKWLNLRKLGELIARGHSKTIDKVVFATAYFPGDHGKKVRHQRYVDALRLVDVSTLLGHTTKEPMSCPSEGCGHLWDQNREKETDINISLSLYEDATDDVFDVAFLITADTDQAATLRFIKRRFPQKKIVVVAPPGRPSSKHLRDLSDSTLNLTVDQIERCLFPGFVQKTGERSVIRPHEYDPPAGWLPPP